MTTIRFVTDSTCDIPPELVQQHQITVVPCFINFGGKSYADDGVSITRDDYYARMPKIRPLATTSAPSPGLTEQMLRPAAEQSDHLFLVTTSAKLSGIHNAFRLAALNSLDPVQYTLIDSGTTAIGLGFQVLLGAEVAAATGSIDATRDAIARVRASVRFYAALATLEYLHHSGRVSWAAASIGGLLQIKPILDVREDEVKSVARVRTFNKAIDELVSYAHAQAPLDRLAVLHTNNLDGAHALRDHLSDIAPADTLIINLNPSVGTHIGPGALGIGTVSTAWKDTPV